MDILAPSSSTSDQDRRLAPRIQLKLPLRYRLEGRPEWQTGATRDVSAAGLLFAASDRIDVSSRVIVLMGVPGEPNARQLHGIVVRAELDDGGQWYLIGIKFTSLDDAGRQQIAAALEQSDIIALLREAARTGAQSLHLSADHPPLVRLLGGRLQPMRPAAIPAVDLRHMIETLMDERQRRVLERELELNFSLSLDTTTRFRVNVHYQRGHVEAAFRRIAPAVRTLAELGLPKTLEQLAEQRDGLVLIAGPGGSGTTTALAALVHHINSARAGVVVTIEHPIEYVHTRQKGVVKQREVGVDTRSCASAVREALRQDPDVIAVGSVPDAETMAAALEAARSGRLVLAVIPGADSVQAIERVARFFEAGREPEILVQLAHVLRAVVCLRLVPRAKGGGFASAAEVLLNTGEVAELIRNRQLDQLPKAIDAGAAQGMQTFKASLDRLVRDGVISDAAVA